MSVTVNFGSFTKKRNSTKQPSGLSDSRSVIFKESTSVDSPTFILTGNAFDYNYATWNDGTVTRYYFITDIRTVKNNLTEIDCVIDVLATYKSQILSGTHYVSYSSEKTSDWLADTRIPLLQSTRTAVNTALTGILSTIGTYVLTVVGKSGSVTYYTQNQSLLGQIIDSISTWETDGINSAIQNIYEPAAAQAQRPPYRYPSDDNNSTCFASLIATIADLADSLNETACNIQTSISAMRASVEVAATEAGFVGNAYANAPQCIRSCIWVPFDYALAPSGTGGGATVFLGNFDTGVAMPATSNTPVTGSTTINIPWHYTDWRRSICEDVYLYLPLVGMVKLSGDSLTHVNSLTIQWSATYTDGVIAYKVKAGSEVIGSYGGQCAANYPLGINQQASAGEVMNAIIQGTEKAVSSLIDSTVSPISTGAAIGGFTLNALAMGYNVENVKKSSHISAVGGVGGGAGIGLGRDVVCYTVDHQTVINPTDMVATMGYPTMKPTLLSTLSGFCQCANAHCEANAMAIELDAIDSYLNNGFFIE